MQQFPNSLQSDLRNYQVLLMVTKAGLNGMVSWYGEKLIQMIHFQIQMSTLLMYNTNEQFVKSFQNIKKIIQQNMTEQNEIIQLALKVLHKRRSIFLRTVTKEEFTSNMQGKSIHFAEQTLNKLYGKSNDLIYLMTDCFIKFSRIWEIYSLDSHNRRRFQKIFYIPVYFSESYRFLNIFANDFPTIEVLQDKNLLDKVKQNIKQNIKVVQFIVQSELSENDIDQYFQDQQFYLFRGKLATLILGFSSYDGKRVYISEKIEQQSYKYLNDLIIEAQIMDNIYFWMTKNKNPFLIMTDINQKMFGQGGDPLEASDYYLYQVYNAYIHYPCPIMLSTTRNINHYDKYLN
ncbi:hypothetical protein pb186bvf_009247 [Paramecium bursaria]